MPSSEVAVLPGTTAPRSRRSRTKGSVRVARRVRAREPKEVGSPATS